MTTDISQPFQCPRSPPEPQVFYLGARMGAKQYALEIPTRTVILGVAAPSTANDDAPMARFTFHSRHLAKLDRFVAQAQRHATRSGGHFAGVVVEIDTAGTLRLYAAGVKPLVL